MALLLDFLTSKVGTDRRAVRSCERHSGKARLARPFHRAARPAVEPYHFNNRMIQWHLA
jgi:hypothetical protein